jgi:hypothetical protein
LNRRNPRVARAMATALATWHRGVRENGRKGAPQWDNRERGEERSEDGTTSSLLVVVCACVCLCARAVCACGWKRVRGVAGGVEGGVEGGLGKGVKCANGRQDDNASPQKTRGDEKSRSSVIQIRKGPRAARAQPMISCRYSSSKRI